MFRSVKRGLTLSMKYILNLGHQPISGLREYMRVFSWKFCIFLKKKIFYFSVQQQDRLLYLNWRLLKQSIE